MTSTIDGIPALRELVGSHLGYSSWHVVTQDQIDLFAEATGDHQWIHVDPEKAQAGPFGTTIAHGFLTLSLASTLLAELIRVSGVRMGVNYGLNRVRFPSPVPVGARIRIGATLDRVEDVTGGVQVTLTATWEVDGQDKPACVAEQLLRYYL